MISARCRSLRAIVAFIVLGMTSAEMRVLSRIEKMSKIIKANGSELAFLS